MMASNLPVLSKIRHDELDSLEVLGQGGFGVAYRARYPKWGTVVYKQLDVQKLGDRVEYELQKEARTYVLQHMNIVTLFAIIVELHHYGIVMEYVLHGALNDFIFLYDVDWPLKMSFAYNVVCGMKYLHSQQPPLIHSDLKCANILVSENLLAKLTISISADADPRGLRVIIASDICDFGFAKWKHQAATQTTEERRRVTLPYMAPEVFVDPGTERTIKYDVYGFAILVWELLSEKELYPFAQGNEEQIKEAVKSGNRPLLDVLTGPADLEAFVKTWIPFCWRNEPQDRPSFEDMEQPFADITRLHSHNYTSYLQLPPKQHSDATDLQATSFETQLVHTMREGSAVLGIATVGNHVYLLTRKGVEVYDVTNCNFLRLLTVPNVKGVAGMTSCQHYVCLYICDHVLKCIHRLNVAANANDVTQWPVHDEPCGLSVNPDNHNLLVTCPSVLKVKEFSSRGDLVRDVTLADDVTGPWHTIQLPNTELIVCHGGRHDVINRVVITRAHGKQVLRSHGGQRGSGTDQCNVPIHLAVNSSGFAFVVHLNNRRVKLLSSTLGYMRDVLSRDQFKWFPTRLCLDVVRRRLYVTDNDYKDGHATAGRVLVFSV